MPSHLVVIRRARQHVLLARLPSCVDVLTSDTLPSSGEPDIALATASVRNRALRAIRVDAPGSPEIW